MKVSREQVAENRARILDVAGRLFRERGFADVSVAEVMQAAGMTHGGFYNHFKSKDDLITRTLEHVTGQDAGPGFDFARYADAYLSPEHCHDRAGGCPIAALGTEAGRQSGDARAVMSNSLKRQIKRFAAAKGVPSEEGDSEQEARDAAIGAWATMVGAVVLARSVDDHALSQEVLAGARRWLDR